MNAREGDLKKHEHIVTLEDCFPVTTISAYINTYARSHVIRYDASFDVEYSFIFSLPDFYPPGEGVSSRF